MYADIEQKIIDRLTEKMGPEVHVGPMRDQQLTQQFQHKAPAVWVIYDGYTVASTIENAPQIAQLVQSWIVVISAKSARGNGGEQEARDIADGMSRKVLGALLGFHLGSGKYLRVSDAPGPEYAAGYCDLPLLFTNASTFRGDPN